MTVTAIVTGGGSGIGLALCRHIVQHRGHAVVADIDGEAAEAAAAMLCRAGPGTAEPARLDVADAAAVTELVATTHDRRGRLDYLFNNAGIGAAVPPEHLDAAHWDRTIDVNLRGVINGCQAAYPLLLRQGFGRIVNTASLAGLVGGVGFATAYATTKHGVVGLSLALRVAAADSGVGVHVVCPGPVDTPILDKTEFRGLPLPEGIDVPSMRELSPPGWMTRFASPEDIAADVFRGIGRDRAIIVTPWSARLGWWMWRLAPESMLRASARMSAWLADRAAGSRRPRA